MKKEITALLLILFSVQILSATITIEKQPEGVYNLGNIIDIPLSFNYSKDISGILTVKLICSGSESEFYKNGLAVYNGKERKITASLILDKDIIGNSIGNCYIQAQFGEEKINSKTFIISNKIIILPKINVNSTDPGETILITGEASREDGEKVSGTFEVLLKQKTNKDTILSKKGEVIDGKFSTEISLPSELPSGMYKTEVTATEKDSKGRITNQGLGEAEFFVNQVPRNIELLLDKTDFLPSEEVKIKPIIHDQSGEPIISNITITVKNSEGKEVEKDYIETDKEYSFEIPEKEKPSEWKIEAKGMGLEQKIKINILPKKDFNIEIINDTLIVTNTGNIPFNETIPIKIGNETINLNVSLEFGEAKQFQLTAPDGNYTIEIQKGNETIKQNVVLTGRAISIKELGKIKLLTHPIVWIFLIVLLAVISYIIYKKGYKRVFIGRFKEPKIIHERKKEIKKEAEEPNQFSITETAEMELSLKGTKSKTELICIKIKNFDSIISNLSKVKGTLLRITKIARENKLKIYVNNDYIFLIASPVITKTFKNERTVIEIAEKIKEILDEHNSKYEYIINYGISLHTGEMIARKEGDILKFMALGTFMIKAKKTATLADKTILLTSEFNEKAMHEVRTTKKVIENTNVYEIKKIREKPNSRFISEFLSRLEKKD